MFKGSIVAIVTPMTGNGDLDLTSLSKLLEWHCQAGTSAVVVCGTTGEASALTAKEYARVIETSVDVVAGRLPVIVGVGSTSTNKAIELGKIAEANAVQASLCVTPYYVKPTQQGLKQHYLQLAENLDLPILLYNVPSRTGVDLLPATCAELANERAIVGIKDASGDMDRARELFAIKSDQWVCLSGDDASACEYILAGGDGVISVTANIVPELMAKMVNAALANDQETAEVLDQRLTALNRDLFIEANPTPIKWLLEQQGKISGGLRLPLLPLTEKNQSLLLAAFNKAISETQS